MSEQGKRVVRVAGGATAVTLVGGGLVVSGPPVQAASFTASDEASLRQAIYDANGAAGADVIEIAGETIVLTNDLPDITDELSITGQGQDQTVIDGAGDFFVFYAVSSAGSLTVENLTITKAYGISGTGSATISKGASLTITDVEFDLNYSEGSGGAVWFEPDDDTDTLSITTSVFTGNEARAGRGGAIGGVLRAGSFDVTDSTFTDNYASQDGGAIALYAYYESGSGPAMDITIADSTFEANVSGYEGGAVYVDGVTDVADVIEVSGSTFTDNEGLGDGGGAVFLDTFGTVTIAGSVFAGNSSLGYGGAVYVVYADATVTDSEFDANTAGEGGGAIEGYEMQSLTVQNSSFTGNSSATQGGAIYFDPIGDGAELSIRNSTFTGNSALYGGAVRATGYDGAVNRIENSTFAGNDATYVGGTINHGYGTLIIDQSTITGNTAAYSAGVIQVSGSLEVRNSTITANEASAVVGGVYVGLYGPSNVASTKRGGRSGKSGSAERADAPQVIAQTVTVVNSIIWGNTDAGDADTDDLGVNTGEAAVDFSLIGISNVDVPNAGSGNLFGVENDPLLGALADNGGDTETMVPAAGSPAIDAGDSAVKTFETDQRGAARVQGDAIDIGAVETQPEPETTTTQAPSTTQGPTTTQGPATLPPTGGSARTGVLAAMLTGLGAVLTLGATRRRRAD